MIEILTKLTFSKSKVHLHSITTRKEAKTVHATSLLDLGQIDSSREMRMRLKTELKN